MQSQTTERVAGIIIAAPPTAPKNFKTIIEPHDAFCEDCQIVQKQTRSEFCPECGEVLIELERLI